MEQIYIFLYYFTDVETEAQKHKDLNPSHMSVKGTSGGSGWVELLGELSGRFGFWHLSQVCNRVNFAWECILGDMKKEDGGDEEKCLMTRIQDAWHKDEARKGGWSPSEWLCMSCQVV